MTNMRKTIIGIITGVIAGVIDVIPMMIMKLTWDANLSAFLMWIVIGFITSRIELKINHMLKGILISYLVLLPSAILIGWNDPKSLIPIFVMTTILGGLVGFSINKLVPKK